MKNKYSESVKKLRAFLLEKESLRQDWAKEKWSHANGNVFTIGRVLVPIVSVVGFCLMFIVCLIRFANIPEINRMLAGSVEGTNDYMVNDPTIYPFFVLVFLSMCFGVYIFIRFIAGKYKKSAFMLFFNSLFLCLCAGIRYVADQGTFPDNSDFELGPTFSYYEYALATLVVFAVLVVYALILVILNIKDKREFEQNVEHTLLKIVNKSENGDLLTEEEYAKLIDDYIEKQSKK